MVYYVLVYAFLDEDEESNAEKRSKQTRTKRVKPKRISRASGIQKQTAIDTTTADHRVKAKQRISQAVQIQIQNAIEEETMAMAHELRHDPIPTESVLPSEQPAAKVRFKLFWLGT